MILLSLCVGVVRPTWGWAALVFVVSLFLGGTGIAIALFVMAGLFMLKRHGERAKPGAGEGKPDGGTLTGTVHFYTDVVGTLLAGVLP